MIAVIVIVEFSLTPMFNGPREIGLAVMSKSITFTETVTEWARLPKVPVTSTVKFPAPGALTVRV